MLFNRLGKLEDRIVGRSVDGKRRAIRWPKEIISFKKTSNKKVTGMVMFLAGGLLDLVSVLGYVGCILTAIANRSIASLLTVIEPMGVVGALLIIFGLSTMNHISSWEDALFCKISDFMEPLLGKDPYLTLGAAAFLTVGAMPEWLRKQMDPDYGGVPTDLAASFRKDHGDEGVLEWRRTHLIKELFSRRREGSDYKDLMDRIELRGYECPERASVREKIRLVDELYSRKHDGSDCRDLLDEVELRDEPKWQKIRLAEKPYTVERAGLDYLDLMNEICLLDWYPSMFHGKTLPPADYRLPSSLKAAVSEIILFLSSLPDEPEPSEDVMEAVMDTIDSLATIDGESFTAAVRRRYEEDENGEKAGKQYEAVQQDMAKLSKMAERARESADGQRATSVSPQRLACPQFGSCSLEAEVG